ncbi:MAG: MFS transporter [Geothrix sp.]|uniref:MFS transporter n=1 Tax=Geothrix sp. TaxID=1962974 RepID=UPI0017D42B7C|nr:MFS transporter [Geothrix sp.]NWJ39511.1 MFS transporter [Geothrix sp.]WIL19268.1 MAG: MFS transporter [Geothrix sp.]
MDHSPAFRLRRFLNWFPLGLTYAAMYMGRYNFNIVKNDIGAWYHLDKAQMGLIASAGFWTYGLAVALNGPIADRIGGRKAILVGSLGAALLNLLIGFMFLNGDASKVLVSMSLLWSLNMYFQSFGALSVVKVNSTWFHVQERGVFGGIFGIMISSGYFLATTIGAWLLASFRSWTVIWFVPAAAMTTMFVIDWFLVRNRPSHAGQADFDTGDGSNAASAEDAPLPLGDLFRKVFHNPVIVALIFAEFCTGFVRQGVMLYFTEYLQEVYHLGKKDHLFWWTGIAFMGGGILGGLLCGWMSDKLFQSRRPPVAFLFYLVQVAMLGLLGMTLGQGSTGGQVWAVILLGLTAMFIFGVHGMLSGTASMDFGGRKAAASVAGALDGIQYIGSGLTGFGLGWVLKTYGWDGTPLLAGAGTHGHQPANAWIWVGCIIPFSLIGAFIMTRIWNAKAGAGAH